MLQALEVRDFGLIEHVELVFGTGLNLITGETGAGKSMLIDAMVLVCGGRASTDMIRTGSQQASVDAVFVCTDSLRQRVAGCLAEAGLQLDDDEIIISREINTGGRNVCRINGRMVPVAVVRDLAAHLVDIHGQHEHQSLLQPSAHRELLDSYGGPGHLELLMRVRVLYAQLEELRERLAAVAGNARDRAQRQDLLSFQLVEIEAAQLMPGEDELLRQERALLVNVEKLTSATDAAYAALFQGDAAPGYGGAGGRAGRGGGAATAGPGGGGESARDALGSALGHLESAAALDPRLEQQADTLRALVYSLDDLAGDLRHYREGLEFDPTRLDQIQSRLELLANLRRKYADTLDGVLAYREGIREQLAGLAASEETAARLESDIAAVRAELVQAAESLSAARADLAAELESQVASELTGLGMPQADFRVQIHRLGDERPNDGGQHDFAVGQHGADQIEFLLSPNAGEPPRRLARAASGGELSRIMLAIKTVLAQADRIPVVIFDEVDSGIGGRTANAVGLRLAALGATRQVLCVTHLPQIAAYADQHFVVSKEAADDRTRTLVRAVSDQERLLELTRMLGAEEEAQAAIEHARELVRRAQDQLRTRRRAG